MKFRKKNPIFPETNGDIHTKNLLNQDFFFWFLITSYKSNVCAWHQNLCRRVSKKLKYRKYANIPKRYRLMQKIANTVQVSNFRYIVYLFSGISIKLSLKWALVEPSWKKLTFSYNIGLKTKIRQFIIRLWP